MSRPEEIQRSVPHPSHRGRPAQRHTALLRVTCPGTPSTPSGQKYFVPLLQVPPSSCRVGPKPGPTNKCRHYSNLASLNLHPTLEFLVEGNLRITGSEFSLKVLGHYCSSQILRFPSSNPDPHPTEDLRHRHRDRRVLYSPIFLTSYVFLTL